MWRTLGVIALAAGVVFSLRRFYQALQKSRMDKVMDDVMVDEASKESFPASDPPAWNRR